jgi:hypothetical protein
MFVDIVVDEVRGNGCMFPEDAMQSGVMLVSMILIIQTFAMQSTGDRTPDPLILQSADFVQIPRHVALLRLLKRGREI